MGGLWEYQALALDRKLEQPLAAPVTGTVIDLAPRYPVQPAHSVGIHLKGWNAAGPPAAIWEFWVYLEPYSALAAGTLLTPAQQADAIKAAWVVALPLAKNLTTDRKSTRLNSSHIQKSRMPSSA